ncbi:reverse transcriptase domain-containing protein [Citrus sinensis]|uniref:uncharacterized protein LOC127899952 n=1 Tax=Citrus sinensis TaxID=2711 RepID=UPI00219AA3A1|nr:uncharacterized protein LOC127899952 [Citrus sinensis]KAH9651249.1 reverse transcriptase domain-containing protein [Citrus sinensis]
MTARQMQGKASKLQFQNCFAVDREGLGGGLAMCWTEDINVEIKSFSKHHVDAVVHSEEGRFWRCTGIYGHPETDQKKHTWELLRSSINPSREQMDVAVEELPAKVTEEMGNYLDQPFTEEEVADALAQMCPTKAPGPDGLPAAFFQKHWSSVKEGVVTTCLHVLNEGGNLAPLNHTYIALIPKENKPKKVTEFRPISLCNVIYRIIAKTMENRLKQILNDIISPTQSAFVPGRLIMDNLVIGYECLNKIRQSRSKKRGLVALKLDISKAYDRIEWNFVKHTMQKLGFSEKWVSLVMNCISTASFSVLINRVPKGLITPQRGLRQGCPLSPYIFIMCAEVLSNLLVQAENRSLIQGLKFNRSLSVTHLLFADDSLVFARASSNDCRILKGIFDSYAAASRKVFNFEKSSMLFSSGTSQIQKEEFKNIFRLNVVTKHERYLGLPSMVGRRKISFFNEIKLRVLSKLSSWQSKKFSCGGKKVLIKAVVQAIPAYAMSVFKIPQGLCEDIEKAISRFWWGSSDTHRSIHWARWERLSHAKIRGGLGFREFSCFNQALITKQRWRILHNPESLMAQILKAKYFKHSNFMEAKLGSNPSYVWRSILWGRQVLHKGLRWRIGDEKQVKISGNNWVKSFEIPRANPHPSLSMEAVVAELIDGSNKWREDLIGQSFSKETAERILRTPLPKTPRPDKLVWHFDKHGIYSVKSGYQLAVNLESLDRPSCSNISKTMWKVIWVNDIPEKRCCRMSEDVFHALVGCSFARKVWKLTDFYEEIKGMAHQDMLSVLQELAMKRGKKDMEQIIAVCWQVWKPPPPGCFKVNVDAATNLSKQRGGIGAVVRDSRGDYVAAAAQRTTLKGNVADMEAEAVLLGIQVARKANCAHFVIESDSKEVVELVLKRKRSLVEISWNIEEIQECLKGQNTTSILYVPRRCNVRAHNLAKVALDCVDPILWIGNCPVPAGDMFLQL